MSLLCVIEQARLWQDCVFIEAPLGLLCAHITRHKLRVYNKTIIFLFLNQNIWCGYSKEQSQ